ncbi:RrF2 family transcriptional regulator [Clostridium fungisolvens]|uniref:HTH-type transcriptional repressor NsrR n=1 Tax=Clostridium fungisolvens TaxID=1604897 RepID=A0A6V8SK73_9CLOT|nr:Rrf2 family transcriptional regulator [Clostridium fungisolvens]GFP77624.1 HTH-type transcriptional repressor NsrR [Clostridium fungisolvens]
MKITQEVDYALRVVLYFCKLDYGTKIEARSISEHEKVPIRFLLKILRKLTHAKIVSSYRGVNGGYSLAKLPQEIHLNDVIEAIDGPTYVAKCIGEPEICNANRSGRCQLHNALNRIQNIVNEQLNGITFDDIMNNKFN